MGSVTPPERQGWAATAPAPHPARDGQLRDAVAEGLHRVGLGLGRLGPSLWVHGPDVAHFESALPALRELSRTVPRYGQVLTIGDRPARRALRARCPEAVVLPPPLDAGPAVRRLLERIDPRALLVLESTRGLGRRTLDEFARQRRPILVVQRHADPRSPVPIADVPDAPIGAARILLVAEGTLTPTIVAEVMTMLREAPAPEKGRLEALCSLTGLGAMVARLFPGLLARRAKRIVDLGELFEQLGRPERLLCLGNGPSSCAPELTRLSFDCLFRVNWRWVADGRFAQPQMVFTGDASGLGRVPAGILGVRTIAEEAHALRQRMLRPRPWRIRYATLERLPLILNERRWAARPTNGAAMIATAAALQPKRLVIAGMDLFEHPAGAYPGDTRTPNAYLAMHDRHVEISIIVQALARFRGEAVILSAPLRERLARTSPAAP